MTMPVVRQQTQVHDGFATIRSRGLCRSRSRAEDFDRYRTVSLRSDFSFKSNSDVKNGDVYSSAASYADSLYSAPSPQYITFRPPVAPVAHDYQNVSQNNRRSFESLKNGRISRTPDSSLGESISTFSNNDSVPCGSVRNSMSSSMHEAYSPQYCTPLSTPYSTSPKFSLLQPDLLHSKVRRPPIRSATLSYRRAASCNDSPLSVYEPKSSIDFYNPSTNYYSPSEVTNRCSSAENLELAAPAWRGYREPPATATANERRYHTLGHTRGAKDAKKTGHESLSLNPTPIKSWESSSFNSADYADPLDWKIGCQTTLRSKPLVPWYELATMRGSNRRSCPPFEAHVVAAFEQSLSNMTQRLQQLTATAERKDGELTEMRQTIELLRKQSIQAGLTTAHMQSMGVQTNNQTDAMMRPATIMEVQSKTQPPITANGGVNSASGIQRHHSSDSMCSLNSVSSGCSAQDKKKKKGWLRSSFTKAFSRNAKISKTNRHMSSTQSGLEQQHQNHHHHHQGTNAAHLPSGNVTSLPPPSPTKSPQKILPIIENAKPVDAIEVQNNPVVEDLKKQLREKDLVLTDIRLEALSSASQLESLKDTVMKMRQEMMTLKQNNERLQKLVTSRSLAGSEASLGNAVSPNGSIGECRRYSLADGVNRPPMELPKSLEEEVEEENIPPAPAPEPPPPPLSPTSHIDLTPPPPAIEVPSPTHHGNSTAVEEVNDHTDGKKISIAVYLGQPESFVKYAEEILESDNYYCAGKSTTEADGDLEGEFEEERELKRLPDPSLNEFVVAYTYISGKTTWQNLDYIVRKTFKDYVARVDPGTNLGLNTDSITSYHLGEAKRGPEMGFPELLPCGYIVGNVRTLYICLQGVGCLAFDSLIPRSIVHRYISLLTEHRRLILCGPSGTGKSYLARKLAEFLVARSGRGNLSEAIATFNVDHKSSKELRQYLGHIAEQASMSNGASELPSVIILDNLHHASSLGDVFSSLLSAGPAAKLPCIIGTMSQATCNTTNLQLHHNFRWVLTANHMEPVKGFLGRFLRRRLFAVELSTHTQQPELNSVLAWLPTVWQHINRFLENHSSSDVTIGPRLFLSCPLDLKESQVWFTDIWNYHLSPYLVEAVREGVQLYGRRGGAWNDPSTFIRDTYPWPYGPDSVPPLRQINAEDVGLEADAPGNSDTQDPLCIFDSELHENDRYLLRIRPEMNKVLQPNTINPSPLVTSRDANKLNMLMRLQEAANYSGNQEQESDCASLDSNITPDSSAGAE